MLRKILMFLGSFFLFLSLALAVPPNPPANPDTPEPVSMILLAAGGAALIFSRNKKNYRK